MAEQKRGVLVEYRSQGGVDIQLTPDVVRNFLVQGKKELVSSQELMYFMNVCRARKLNPFIKDCYLIKYGSDPAAIVTSVDYFRKNARKAPDCKGWQAGIVILQNGEITCREGSLILENETLVGGWAEALPEGWNKPKRHTINLAGYIKKKRDGTVTRFWESDKQPDMIAKVAESQLLRQLWGEETTGMYSAEEMPSIEDIGKVDGPVQSDIKQRIMDGEKKADPVVDAEYVKDSVGPDPKATKQAEAAARISQGINDRKKAKQYPPAQKAADELPAKDIDPPVTEALTDDQIIATEKAFSMLCKSAKFTDAESYRYLKYLTGLTQMEPVHLMRTIIDDPKANFEQMRKWLDSHPAEPATAKPEPTEPEDEPKNGKKKFALADLPHNEEIWKVENWGKLTKKGFSTFVWKNIETLDGEPDPLIHAVKHKWEKFYDEDFPVAKANGIETETYYDPSANGNGKKNTVATKAPDKENDPREYVKWLKGDFPEAYKGALDYLGFSDVPETLSDEAVDRLIKSTEQLIDMEAE